MKKNLAFVLGGGGARGALQVGALKALLEAGYQPDLLVGTSIGAANAAFLALYGCTTQTIAALAEVWRKASAADLITGNYMRLTMRTLLRRMGLDDHQQIFDFFTTYGFPSDLRFGDIQKIKLIVVAADLRAGRPVLFGEDPDELVVNGLMASVALPPFFMPLRTDGRYLVDGTFVSSLPIEPAIVHGADEIIALDLTDPQDSTVRETRGMLPFVENLINTMEQRQIDMELKIAAFNQVSVRRMALYGDSPVAIWNFQHSEELMRRGYEIACREIDQWKPDSMPWWRKWMPVQTDEPKKNGKVIRYP
ncbi:MAG: patatin-like phospholipase family protein [Anaerolineaceae bacterium]|nr:patatin-like phospholipase family protein [Anaerolineaceae bacterium]